MTEKGVPFSVMDDGFPLNPNEATPDTGEVVRPRGRRAPTPAASEAPSLFTWSMKVPQLQDILLVVRGNTPDELAENVHSALSVMTASIVEDVHTFVASLNEYLNDNPLSSRTRADRRDDPASNDRGERSSRASKSSRGSRSARSERDSDKDGVKSFMAGRIELYRANGSLVLGCWKEDDTDAKYPFAASWLSPEDNAKMFVEEWDPEELSSPQVLLDDGDDPVEVKYRVSEKNGKRYVNIVKGGIDLLP